MAADTSSCPALIGISLSHYVEKARWGLQRYGIHYTEEMHAPGPHRFAVKAAGGCGTVPCLRLPRPPSSSGSSSQTGSASTEGSSCQTSSAAAGRTCVDGSTAILHWVDEQASSLAAAAGQPQPLPPLFPPGEAGQEVEQLCKEFDDRLGPAVRCWVYSHLLYTPCIARAMASPPAPLWERMAMRCGGWWLLRPLMVKGMRINPENGKAKLQRIRSIFDSVAERLADGRPYLVGDAFTAADLTFAALAAPAVGQPYAVAPGLGEETPPEMREVLLELRAHPAGKFALRLWEKERHAVLGRPRL
ncbi:hypothetical protein N2152v2_004375 [Parachlorella kessleri]